MAKIIELLHNALPPRGRDIAAAVLSELQQFTCVGTCLIEVAWNKMHAASAWLRIELEIVLDVSIRVPVPHGLCIAMDVSEVFHKMVCSPGGLGWYPRQERK